MLIVPDPSLAGERATASLVRITAGEISRRLGFEPNRADDKTDDLSWGFSVDGVHCGVWSFKGSHRLGIWSTFGPREALAEIFGEHLEQET